MEFDVLLERYAELLVVHGLNIQPGQVLNISTEPIHGDFALRIAAAAYARGAKFVNIDLGDPRLTKLRVERAAEDSLSYVPEYFAVKYDELLDSAAANLKLIGSEFPDVLEGLDPKRVNTIRLGQRLALKNFYDEGIGKSKVHWTVAAASTPAWAQKIFPQLSPEQADQKLWEQIFRICRVDQPNYLERWREHNAALHTRAEKLSQMGIEHLHFVGPGTDLLVGLSPLALFKGGTDTGPRGVDFEPNIPTEEVFTTPDWRKTAGTVKATRPFLINGVLIQELELKFDGGEIVDYRAKSGLDTFREYINSDEGGKRLGEVALVGIDSPVFQSGLVFREILFDENAACHIAVGSAYKFCLKNGANLSQDQLKEIGCNDSTVHTDMMISSEHIDVRAKTYAGEEILLIEKGRWVL